MGSTSSSPPSTHACSPLEQSSLREPSMLTAPGPSFSSVNPLQANCWPPLYHSIPVHNTSDLGVAVSMVTSPPSLALAHQQHLPQLTTSRHPSSAWFLGDLTSLGLSSSRWLPLCSSCTFSFTQKHLKLCLGALLSALGISSVSGLSMWSVLTIPKLVTPACSPLLNSRAALPTSCLHLAIW